MQSREEIFATLQRLKGEIAARFSVSRIGIFGSVARGEQTEASDIDILVEFSRPIGFFAFLELEEFLSLNLAAPVDLVTPDALKPIIRERVAAEVAYA
ncbi:nucleotidyltransferase family protein [Methanoculleus sp. Afa-1]|uniref:protein adenylyltransferase n=1 Tax=Methanoculleus formosensis TaxID=2590886 RepID=A0A9E5DFA4_9EURY|nr:nucleotidyltransferase family protein [Methanoculleus sp. Afa-1]MCT8337440.1 nucleotidyltransferase family protein [Methanoculleus sp. Afa-1]